LVCIAGDFTRYDEHAVQQINRSIELIRHKRYGGELLLLQLVNAVVAEEVEPVSPVGGTKVVYKSVSEYLADADTELRDRFEALKAFLTSLGDDVQMKTLKHYIAFTRIKNFACTVVHTQTRNIIVWVKLEPHSVELVEGFTRDVSDIGHHGTGDVEITIRNKNDWTRPAAARQELRGELVRPRCEAHGRRRVAAPEYVERHSSTEPSATPGARTVRGKGKKS
jgi:predicted transport protein